mgnify:CR=1 FL=1
MNKKYDLDLINLYQSSGCNVTGYFTENLIGEDNFYNKTYDFLRKKDLSQYDCIFFIRVDFFLKPYFKIIYNYKDNRILFAHINEICRGYHSNHYNEPSVNYMMLHIPNKFFDKLLSGKVMD